MLIRRGDGHVVLEDEAGDGAAAGGSAGAGAGAAAGGGAGSGVAAGAGVNADQGAAGGQGAGAGGNGAPGDGATKGAAGAPGEGTLLSQAAGAGAGAAAGAGADPLASIPEKFKVVGADGKLDAAATLAKVWPSAAALEKRMGEGGAPPENADGYKTDGVVAAIKEANGGKEVQMPAELTKEFNAFAHKAKLSQAQYDQALTGFMAMIPTLVDQGYEHAMKNGRAELSKAWGPDGVKPDSAQMKSAVRAFNRFVPQPLRTAETMDAIGNHPVVMQILAAVGAELKEDTSLNGETPGVTSELDQLYASSAYWNKKDANHEWTVNRVKELMASGAKPKVTRGRQAVKL